MPHMIRTQIQFREEQVRALKRRASQRGVSLSELVREAVDRSLESEETEARWQRALSVVGRFRSGHSDISERHDDYLAEDFM